MLKVLIFSLGQMQANCYFLIDENKCLLIDPGDSSDFILTEIQRRQLQLTGILATHGHFDHVMAVGEIQFSYKVPLYIFQEDSFLIDRLGQTAKHFLGFEPSVVKPSLFQFIDEGKLQINPFKLDVIRTPGHTPGSCCFYLSQQKVLFSGDTLFKQGIGRYDFSYSNKRDLKDSLTKLFNLPEDITVYPGHGESTTLKEEEKSAQQLRRVLGKFTE